jgi:hypothetical protein
MRAVSQVARSRYCHDTGVAALFEIRIEDPFAVRGPSMPSAGGVHVIIRALCRWHFQPAGGPEYCRACRDDDLPCARGEPGADGRLCPYGEHALISRQEHETWGVLLACQGQVRLAPSGHIVGIDMGALLSLATARGYDLAALSELLPEAEMGLIEALHASEDGEARACSQVGST